ncbi:MAG: glucose-6-phosphate isomerase [Eubacteriaceae bacterium]|nr:glucose-6-phosphate isomerase [Eubacteriaceae bacterium]
MTLKVDYSNTMIKQEEIDNIYKQIILADSILKSKEGPGSDYLGWLDYPVSHDKEEFERIIKAAEYIKENCEVLIVIGIGGSYLGSKAVIDALSPIFVNELDEKERKAPKIYFAGQNISGKYLKQLYELVKDKNIMVNVISKSGTTTEPAIAFRVFKALLEEKYGKEASKKRIFVTTDKSRGALKTMAEEQGYESFVIPDNVGGRFSVHTAVGLLPIAAAGIDIRAFMKGAEDSMKEYTSEKIEENACYQYVAARNVLLRKSKEIEIMVNYEPEMTMFAEWWKQLFGESEGKEGKGIFPVSVNNSTDLHSLGQIIQDGKRNIFESVIVFENHEDDSIIPSDTEDLDGLNYIAGMGMNYVNQKAFEGTLLAHIDGGVPNIIIRVDKLDAYNIGRLVYFYERACGISGYILGVNPFDQPGVEAYKKNMFALLGKKGYEELAASLKNR